MHKQVVWSSSAENDFDKILNYLNDEWGLDTTLVFMQRTFKLIDLIASNPKTFPLINIELSIRKCVLSKHNTLFYRESTKQIDILRIFDTRQSPDKLTLNDI